jgi:alpha-tubulin suppressor-like RCC1 family protein
VNVAKVDGGEHHSICLTTEGHVYCWGRNDESQCGAGDRFGAFERE